MGSPHYIAPEQARNQNPDQRCDIYSLGVLLYHMLTGRVPFTASAPVDIILKHLHEQPVPPRDVRPDLGIDPGLQEIVLRCMAKAREDRFQTMDELLAALKRVRTQVTGVAGPNSMPPANLGDTSPGMAGLFTPTPSAPMRTPSQPMSAMPTPAGGSPHPVRPPPPPPEALEEGLPEAVIEPGRKPFPKVAVAAALVVLLGGGAGFALFRRAGTAEVTVQKLPPASAPAAVAQEPAPAAPAEQAKPAAVPEPAAGTTLVDVTSQPEGAEVRDQDERVVGTTPFEFRVASARPLELTFRHEGFKSTTVKKTVEGEHVALSVTLKRDKGAPDTTQPHKRSVGYKDDPY
jgi:serine/threonine-protein kinase